MYLILIETSGNQNYIFSSNKLRENIGASELTYRAGTQWVLEAVANLESKLQLWAETNKELRKNLLEKSKPLENSDYKIEVIVATSGKALLLVKEEEIGRQIIREVTKRALIDAPGLDVCGVTQKFDFQKENLSNINRKIHQEFETVRSKKPSPLARFLRLPVVEECSSSGWGASRLVKVGNDGDRVPLSAVSAVKRNKQISKSAFQRVNAILGSEIQKKLTNNLDKLESKFDELEWLSVIHADGNGLGEIILKFDQQLEAENIAVKNREYVDKLRRFSLALDVCTENAFIRAIDTTFATKEIDKITPREIDKSKLKILLPLVPLVLGGDDLTVVCDGKKALDFTNNFLLAFEEETAKKDLEVAENKFDGIIPQIAGKALGAKRLSACAGIAIIKPSFPFYNAYNLAEELMKSAKTIKKKLQRVKIIKKKQQEIVEKTPWPCSALDFHVLYDASASELDFIRENLQVNTPTKAQTKLYAKPYVVTPWEWLESEKGKLSKSNASLEWVKLHRWQELSSRIEALKAENKEEETRLLPRSQMSDLRSGLFLGKEEADARLNLIWRRYQDLGLSKLINDSWEQPSLFWLEFEKKGDLKSSKIPIANLVMKRIDSLAGILLLHENKNSVWITNFLDAVDGADFLDTSVDLVTSD